MNRNDALATTLAWAVNVDAEDVRRAVAELERRHPGASKRQLAERAFARARLKATATGIVTGLPSNVVTMLPAAAADAATVFRIEVAAAAQVALIYDRRFFDDPDAQWELLVPIFGMDLASQLLRELGVAGAMGITRQLIRKSMSRGAFHALKKIALKYFGVKVTRTALVTKAVPIVGAIVGGAWNFGELSVLRMRCIRYFEGQELGKAGG
jgi:hypothetical protein